MPYTPSSIVVDPAGVSTTVTIRRNSATGTVVAAYTAENGASAFTFPTVISTRTQFWLDAGGELFVSLTAGDRDAGSKAVTLLRGGSASLVSVPQRLDVVAQPLVSGRYTTSIGPTTSAAGGTQSRLRLVPYLLEAATTFTSIGSEVTTLAAASTLRWGVYADSAGVPGSLLLDTGALGDGTATGFKETPISLSLTPGRYWLGCVGQGGNPTMRAFSTSVRGMSLSAAEIVSLSATAVCFYADSVTGSLPDPFVAAGALGSAPIVWLKAA